MVKLWKRWCRLCAKEDSNNTNVNVFLKGEEISLLSDVINKCFAVNITHQDDWPRTICTKCHQLVTTIITFSQRTSKVQAMFGELFNNSSLEEIDAGQLRAQYELHELGDIEFDLKLFANSPAVQLFESKPSMSTDMAEQMIDLEELDYIDEEMLNPTNIKTESADEDGLEDHDPEWKDKLTSPVDEDDNDSDENEIENEYNAPKSEADSDESYEEPKTKRRGRPRKYGTTKVKREKEKEIFSCEGCKKAFARYPNYRHHMQSEHGIALDPPQFPCTKCSKIFTTARRLQDHANTHLPLDQKLIIPCPYCEKKFTKSVVVQSHIRAVHMGEKPFVCEECGKTYKTFGSLKEHKLTHTEERPFKCTWCDKRFKNKSRLKTHEDTHNDTNYICTICGLQLNTRRTLKMHMVVHSDQKRHKCDYCGNEYKRAKALKNHLILHTGLKPYTCNFCEKSFANGSNCRSHKKKAHPIELAAMEAAGTKSVTTNIPKLEQLRAVTSNKAVVVQPFDRDQDFGEGVSVVSLAEDVESLREHDSSTEEQISNHQQTELVHVVFGSMPVS